MLIVNVSPAIARETYRIYKHGLRRAVDTDRVPVLLELADSAISDSATSVEALETLLHRTFAVAAPGLLIDISTTESRIKNGLAELFGLSEHPEQTLEARRDRAGPHFGYASGNEGLRKATRNRISLTTIVINAIAGCLVETAHTFGFTLGPHGTNKIEFWRYDANSSNQPVRLELLQSMGLAGADDDIQLWAEYIQRSPERTAVSPIAKRILTELPALRDRDSMIARINQQAEHQFWELVDLYEAGFNAQAGYYHLEKLSWIVYLFEPQGQPIKLEVSPGEAPGARLLFLLICQLHDDPERQRHLAGLLGLPLSSRGTPRRLREWEGSLALGYQHVDDIWDCGLGLRLLFDLTHALVKLAVDLGYCALPRR